ncbi:hypothetical protein HUW63_06235 [Myxococcus sp. AM001]|nr:hypothetical protein [Myxococcus sp. AM001]
MQSSRQVRRNRVTSVSEGAHRELDRLTQLCLRDAARLKRKLVDGELVCGVRERAQFAA